MGRRCKKAISPDVLFLHFHLLKPCALGREPLDGKQNFCIPIMELFAASSVVEGIVLVLRVSPKTKP